MTIMNGQFLEDEQYVGRKIINALGVDEVVTLPVRHWKHFDWLAAKGYNMDKWTAKLDIGRHDYEGFEISFSAYMEMQLVRDEARRHRAGDDVPLHINPHRPLFLEKTSSYEQEMKRDVTDATGETVTVQLARGYWQYLDWLGKQGTDVAQYIIDADRLREQPKWKKKTLRGVLQLLLLEDEKKRYASDEPSPLYICPEGYDL